MNSAAIPQNLHHLLGVVEVWGISNTDDRDVLLLSASREELIQLIQSISDDDSDNLDKWLCAPETDKMTHEYLSFTSFIMAYDYAKVLLKESKYLK